MTRFLRYSTLAVVSLLLGGAVGYVGASRTMRQGSKIMPQMYALGEYETLTSLEYQQSDSAHGKQALADLLDFMHQVETAQGNEVGNSLEIDRGLTYMRLALLEERDGKKDEAQQYIRRAQESFSKRSNATMTEAELRAAVAKQDSRTRYALPAVFVLRQAKK